MRIEDVIIVGAGPTGLFLAGELAQAGLSCRILERRATRTEESRALGLHARSLEVLDLRGMADEFMERGYPIRKVRLSFGNALVDFGRLDTRFGHMQILPQSTTEEILEGRVEKFGASVERKLSVVDLRDKGDHVLVDYEDRSGQRSQARARWVVGCDGSSSVVRDLLGIGFEGRTYPYTIMVADVRLAKAPEDPLLIHVGPHGLVVSTAFGNGWYRLGVIDRTIAWSDDPVTLEEVRKVLIGVFGHDVGPSDPLWTSRFRIHERQAETYRRGRVLLAGDAAHLHSPLGGQGLNLGIQDAMNLGWKLAAVIRGDAPASLLDTYVRERRQISQRVVKGADIATRALTSPHKMAQRMRGVMAPRLVRRRRPHDFMVGHVSAILAAYRQGGLLSRRTLVGRRLPDFTVADGQTSATLFPFLRDGQFVLVDQTGGRLGEVCAPWGDRVVVVTGRIDREDLRGYAGVLSRPDGYCAWAGPREDVVGLRAALRAWCGHEHRTRSSTA